MIIYLILIFIIERSLKKWIAMSMVPMFKIRNSRSSKMGDISRQRVITMISNFRLFRIHMELGKFELRKKRITT